MKVDSTDKKLIHISWIQFPSSRLDVYPDSGVPPSPLHLQFFFTKIVKYGCIVHDGALGVTLRQKESRLLLTSKSYPSVDW